ncbi:MAG: hypothetical protein ABW095_14780, partial [Candidatus Thiodiazotropha sp.]
LRHVGFPVSPRDYRGLTASAFSLPWRSALEQLIGNLGIGNDTHVVLIPLGASAGDLTQAARLYWTFKVLGHDNVSILNGGLVSYAEARRFPLEKGSNNPTPKAFKAHYRADYNPDTPAVRQAIESGALAVDNRSRAEYLGIYGGGEGTRAGSLPDAVNLNYDWLTVNGAENSSLSRTSRRSTGSARYPWRVNRSTIATRVTGPHWVGSSPMKSWATPRHGSTTVRPRCGRLTPLCPCSNGSTSVTESGPRR